MKPPLQRWHRALQSTPNGWILLGMDHWTIEVFDGEFAAQQWKDAHGDSLAEAAHTNGVLDWQWSRHRWGVVLELSFRNESDWLAFLGLPSVQAALDATPDPVSGLLIYNGRGGGSGSRVPRRPRRPPSTDHAAVPIPAEPPRLLVGSTVLPPPFALAGR